MKVLFLDIDGVLNNAFTKERCLGYTGVDKKLALIFSDWLSRNPDIKVVLSSTWRTDERMWYAIRAEGINWIGITDELGEPNGRNQQINRWVQTHPEITKYAILDDQNYGWFDHQAQYFVQTDKYKGFSEENLKQLDAIFSLG